MTPDELKNWLEGRDAKTAVAIATRIAARVWPLTVSRARLPEPGFSAARAISVARAADALWTGEAADVGKAAADAVTRVRANADALKAALGAEAGAAVEVAGAAARAAEDAARAADGVGAPEAAVWSTGAAAEAAEAVARAADAEAGYAFRAALQADCDRIAANGPDAVRDIPLWPNGENPLQGDWDKARADLRQDPDFGFWVRWYEGLLQGRPMDPALVRDIALIAPDDWDRGPTHIAEKIAGIELDTIRRATPLAEQVEWVPETERIRIVPIPMGNRHLYDTVLDKLRDALDDIRPDGRLSNSHAALAPTLDRLARRLETHADNPQRMHDAMATAFSEVRKLIESNEIADDIEVGVFMRTLDENVLDIQGAMPEVRDAVKARAALRFQQLPEEERKTLTEVGKAIGPHLEPEPAQDDMETDAAALDADDPNTEENKTSLYRLASRTVRILWIERDAPERVTILAGIVTIISHIVAAIRSLLGL
ncbi:MAG: hypothetical protein GDA40_10680 [Rhodobacteraceae bacterium]|nr:hypothetical protein [Paracoccaceae bacterium]